LGAAFDALDGIVARERGVASDSGEVLDAVVDRYADAAPLLGLAVFYRASVPALLLVLIALLGSMLVSYVRAKSEAMSLSLPGGLMRRHERIAYLVAGLLVGPLLHLASVPVEAPLTLLAVGVVAVVSNIAAVSLTRSARAALIEQGRGPGGRA
jgi:CDP-diacylglycerol---glycerol-3-phosphate 3-phosphatidyltransferase